MSYRLRLAGPAERALGELPEKAAAALLEFMLGPLVENPERVGAVLRDEPFAGLLSARVGPYRIIYEVDRERRMVEVLRVGHRADVYRG